MKALTRYEQIVWWVAMLGLLAFRVAHLRGPLDEPSWRQAWCAYQAQRLAQERPMELLHTKINIRGTNDVSFWNFPVYEAVVAVAYRFTGGMERLALARSITLFFFFVSALVLWDVSRRIFDTRAAWFTLVVYFALPIGIFYSRAVHYDIAALAFCHLFVWFALRFFDERRWRDYAGSALAATVAFSMKPPYCFYWALPVLVYAAWNRGWRAWFREGALCVGVFVLPVALAWLFHIHRLNIEAGYEPSILYPVPYTKAYARNWFFGGLTQRMDLALWMGLLRQVLFLALTPLGTLLAGWGVFAFRSGDMAKSEAVLWAALAGVGLYVLVMFPMVARELTHTYYLLPLLVPASWLIGRFLNNWAQAQVSGWRAGLAVLIGCIALAMGSFRALYRYGYFTHDWQRIRAGAVVQRETPEDALIVATAHGRTTSSVDPRSLYFMNRRGWAARLDDLNAQSIEIYKNAGANYVALLVWTGFPTDPQWYEPLRKFEARIFPLEDPYGNDCGNLVLYNLSRERPL